MDFVIAVVMSVFSLITFFGFAATVVLLKISFVEPIHESQMSKLKILTFAVLYLFLSVLQLILAFVTPYSPG